MKSALTALITFFFQTSLDLPKLSFSLSKLNPQKVISRFNIFLDYYSLGREVGICFFPQIIFMSFLFSECFQARPKGNRMASWDRMGFRHLETAEAFFSHPLSLWFYWRNLGTWLRDWTLFERHLLLEASGGLQVPELSKEQSLYFPIGSI